MLTYTVKLEPQKEGGYTVTVPALPGCISEGDTIKEAFRNIKDAIEGYLVAMVKHKRQVPIEVAEIRSINVFKSLPKRTRSLTHA